MSYKEKISLKDSIEFIVDNRGKTVPTSENGIALIATNCINNNSLYPKFKNVRYISEETFRNWFRAHPKPNDIIFTLKGSQNGAACLVPQEVNFAIAQDMVALRANKKLMDPYFLLAALRSKEVQIAIKSLDVSDVIPHFKKGDFDKLFLPRPSLEIQKQIGHVFITLERKIELNRKMNQTLEAMAQALFKSWFVDFDPVIDNALAQGNPIPEELQARGEKRKGLPDSKKLLSTNQSLAAQFPASFVFNETLGKWIPEGWEVKSFGELIETTIGGDWGKEVPDEKHTEEVKIIRGTDIPSLGNCDLESAPTRFVELKKLRSRKLEEGDIVIEVSGGSPSQSTGRSIRITQNILERLGGVAEPASFCRRLKPINQKFSVLCGEHLTYIYGIGKMWEYQNQSTGISNFQTPYFLESEMVLVPSDENVLNSFYSLVSNFKNKSTSNENIILTQLRDRLLPELISGRVRVIDIKY